MVNYLDLTRGEQQIRADAIRQHAHECEECGKVAELEDSLAAEVEAREKADAVAEAANRAYQSINNDTWCALGKALEVWKKARKGGPDAEDPVL